ncbi:MAG TPA: alpha/beta hydrolase [Blastocatellia bacterium]|nr:alpha/beta hydrolase [Blastocatellia bacterium]
MRTAEINGIPLGIQEMGDRKSRTIVFAHALLWGAGAFDEMLTELAKDFHIVAVDIHGHGASGYRDPMTLEEMTEDFYRLLEQLNLRKVTWFGCSIGGMIGMRLALAHPEAIDSLILMSTAARLDPPEIKEATLQLWELFGAGHREDIADPAMKFFFAPRTYQDRPELIEKYRKELIGMKEADGMFAAALAVFNRSDIGGAINRINAPALVIVGRDDLATSPAEAEFIGGQIPNARLEIIGDANHLVAIEKPREITRLVREFLP